jgi:hypothetical protein
MREAREDYIIWFFRSYCTVEALETQIPGSLAFSRDYMYANLLKLSKQIRANTEH